MSQQRKRNIYRGCLAVLILLMTALPAAAQSAYDWQPLFNGKTLDGWTQRGGDARYYVENESIVGVAVMNSPNSFLCTEKAFEDFILEFQVKVEKGLNSGVQIRSNSLSAYKDRRVHGYQVEIDPTDPDQSGGIYDEARRGWLYDRVTVDEARSVNFKPGSWNTYRIEAVGDTMRTWVNGVPAAHLVDNMTAKGFIGLQVHSIGDNQNKKGLTVRWRDLRIMTGSDARQHQRSIDLPVKTNYFNRLTEKQRKAGWKLLFDGQSADSWRRANGNSFPNDKWLIHNSALTVRGEGGGSIVTKKKYADFELKLDFRLTPGANSGIKYYVVENEETAYGLEYQLLDNKRHPDAERGRNGNRRLGALYDILPASDTDPRPVGEWNTARIVSEDGQVEHWLNGEKILEYQRGSEAFRRAVKESKYNDDRFEVYGTRFGEAERGRILLQDHGDEVSFRNIMIKKK